MPGPFLNPSLAAVLSTFRGCIGQKGNKETGQILQHLFLTISYYKTGKKQKWQNLRRQMGTQPYIYIYMHAGEVFVCPHFDLSRGIFRTIIIWVFEDFRVKRWSKLVFFRFFFLFAQISHFFSNFPKPLLSKGNF